VLNPSSGLFFWRLGSKEASQRKLSVRKVVRKESKREDKTR
jgi:hypothetical protein